MADSAPLLQSPNFPIGTTLLSYQGHPTGASAVCWSPDGSRIASSQDMTVQVWDATTGATLMSYHEHSNHVFAVSWFPDGRRIAFCSGEAVHVCDVETGTTTVV